MPGVTWEALEECEFLDREVCFHVKEYGGGAMQQAAAWEKLVAASGGAEEQQEDRGKVCILSIDGGGMRGIIPARVLAYLEELLKRKSGNPEARIADYDFLTFFSCFARPRYIFEEQPTLNEHKRCSLQVLGLVQIQGFPKNIFTRTTTPIQCKNNLVIGTQCSPH
jgi:hypothetical protein